MINILTIDVEDYFMVSAFENIVKADEWYRYESRVVNNTEKVLSLLKKFNVKATFFVLGWVAEKHPSLIKEIYQEGHEISSHGYAHKLVYNQSKEDFRNDIIKAKGILEKIINNPVLGYRAPSYSIRGGNLWALDILAEEGFIYDSSIFPARHARGGIPDAYRFPSRIRTDEKEILEIPLSIVKLMGYSIPIAGGGYFRIFPYSLIQKGIRSINSYNQPAVFYLHPWELDANQPRVPIRGINRFKHYVNLDKTEKKFAQLLSDFKFSSIKDYMKREESFLNADRRIAI